MGVQQPAIRVETYRGPIEMIYPDGRRVAMEREVISVTDFRETCIGPVNFGYVYLLPWRYVEPVIK